MRLSAHVSEDLGLEKCRQSVCSLPHCIFYSCFPIFNSHSPIMCSSLQNAGLGAFWLSLICHCKEFLSYDLQFFKVYSSEYNHVLRVLALTNNYCTNHCSVETAKVVVFLKTLQQENDVVSHLGDPCFRQMLAVAAYVISHKLYDLSESWGCVICYCDWHPINNQEMIAITITSSECPLMRRWKKVNKNLWV